MSRFFLSVFCLGLLGLSGMAQDVSVNTDRLERIRKMSPEERERLLKLVREIKKLPEGEKIRLKDNLRKFREFSREDQKKIRDRAHRLSPEERDIYRGLVAQLNHSFSKEERRKMKGFPRMLFFSWLQNERPADFDRLTSMASEDRGDVFPSLLSDFTTTVKDRVRNHFRKHRCVPPAVLLSMEREDGSLVWTKWHRFVRECRGKRQSDMRRKPPRWQ